MPRLDPDRTQPARVGYHAAGPAFEGGRPVLTVDPWAEPDQVPDDQVQAREVAVRLLALIVDGNDDRTAGRLAFMLAAAMGVPGCPRSCRALAKRWNVSRATAARILRRIRGELPSALAQMGAE